MPVNCPRCGTPMTEGPEAFCPACANERRGSPMTRLSGDPRSGIASPPDQQEENRQLIDFQRALASLTPRFYVTHVLTGMNILVFVAMVISGVSLSDPTGQDLVNWGANFAPRTVDGEWWRLFTCVFVHIGYIHLLLNLWVLAVSGPFVEKLFGNTGFLILYLGAGLTGSMTSLLWNPPLLVSAGASGAIFGIYGGVIGLLLREYKSIPPKVFVGLRNSGLTFVGLNLVLGMSLSKIDSANHIGGLLGGILFGFVLSQPIRREAPAGRPLRNFCVGALVICLVFIGASVISARHARTVGSVVLFGKFHVYYASGVTRAEVDRMGAYLEKEWAGIEGANVKLKQASDGYQFQIVVNKEFKYDTNFTKSLDITGARISRHVFEGAAVEVDVCDSRFRILQAFPPRPDIRFSVSKGTVELFFAADVDRADAERLAGYLASLVEVESIFKLAQNGKTREIHTICSAKQLDDPAFIKAWKNVRKDVAVKVFHRAPVEIDFCDENLNVRRVLER